MRHSNDRSFVERRNTAAEAKQRQLAKFASAPKSTDPAMQERLAAREAIAGARELLRRARDAAKLAENERILAEAAAVTAEVEAGAKAEAELRQAEINDGILRATADEAARKAERDRRYAAREARQG
ncbi:MAG: hypothetical protein KGI75_20805 [Rhizobiaceae bacterium]|nr:hypothetical protein [Rhizobiaceae bacterium]